MGRRRGRTGPGGAVVSSLSENSGGTVKPSKPDKGGPSRQAIQKPTEKKGQYGDEELNKLAKISSKTSASAGSSSSNQAVRPSSSWLGKSPQQMLQEWCSKNSRKRPSYVVYVF